MTPFDDTDLIAGLHGALAKRQSEFRLPDGIGDDARRAAHRRTATRAATAGVPVLAAAGAAAVLAVGPGANSKPAGGPNPLGSVAPVRPVHNEETADIIRRVKAAAADSQTSTVTESVEYLHGDVSTDGSLTNLGRVVGDQYTWTASNGTVYERNTLYNTHGSVYLAQATKFTPTPGGAYDDTYTTINPLNHTYHQGRAAGFTNPTDTSHPGLGSTAAQVRQALQSDQVTVKGKTTISGTPAIALTLATPDDSTLGALLYVNAQTYQPLASVAIPPGNTTSVFATKWVTATPNNIARAKNASIPAGYSRTAKVNDWGTDHADSGTSVNTGG